jgi:hypothetical protein
MEKLNLLVDLESTKHQLNQLPERPVRSKHDIQIEQLQKQQRQIGLHSVNHSIKHKPVHEIQKINNTRSIHGDSFFVSDERIKNRNQVVNSRGQNEHTIKVFEKPVRGLKPIERGETKKMNIFGDRQPEPFLATDAHSTLARVAQTKYQRQSVPNVVSRQFAQNTDQFVVPKQGSITVSRKQLRGQLPPLEKFVELK